uniref:C-type lectin domain family 4 member M-like n=1 Tax=Scatophagus argus TaxID=75038 RepID=UPI001ED7F52D|nr:C-type lectin domain family 4 member M-like [Scatophagus argus]XP_046232128.1 C-type lectin domain family 4 member M-like [Scatophagus argus]
MVGHQWLPWINNPNSSSISVTSAKQEQEMSSDHLSTRKNVSCHHFCPVVGLSTLCLLLLVACAALSVLYNSESNSRPEWKSLLFDYQNISDGYLTLTKENNDLRAHSESLEERRTWLEEQTKLLNRTSAKLTAVNLALSLESTELMEQIVNLTSTNLHLTLEHERLVQHTSEQEEEKLNMSQTIQHLLDSNTLREEERRRHSEVSRLLRDELFELREKHRELLEINDKFQGEIKNLTEHIAALLGDDCEKASKCNTQQLQERATDLQEQNHNLSFLLTKERQEAAEREEQRNEMEVDLHAVREAYHSLDLYCPVVDHRTKERVCKRCEDSWRVFENKCYYFSSRVLTWSSSRAWCQTQGGDLLTIDSEPEQNFVHETSRALDQSGTRLWVGMTDEEEEGEWFWVDGSSVTSGVQFWLSRPGMGTEPDDWKLDDPLGEDCGHIDTSENTLESWMDGSCKIPYRWICEKNV